MFLFVCFLEPQTNGLPEEAHMTLGEEPTYPLDPVEDENTTPIDTNNDEKEALLTTTTTTTGDNKTVPSPGTWAARIAQVSLFWMFTIWLFFVCEFFQLPFTV